MRTRRRFLFGAVGLVAACGCGDAPNKPNVTKENCPACTGTGSVSGRCAICNGTGSKGVGGVRPVPCHSCGGTGSVSMHCKSCGGTGRKPL